MTTAAFFSHQYALDLVMFFFVVSDIIFANVDGEKYYYVWSGLHVGHYMHWLHGSKHKCTLKRTFIYRQNIRSKIFTILYLLPGNPPKY